MNYSLTVTEIKNAKPIDGKPKKLWDGGGLHLFVTATSKSWRYKYRLFGKENLYTLGQFPAVGLAEARERHTQAVKLVNAGIPPLTQQVSDKVTKQLEAQYTFSAVSAAWLKTKGGCTAYYQAQIEHALNSDLLPAIGKRPIKDIKAAEILKVLKNVEGRGAPVVAMNIKQWCSAIYDFAVQNLLAEHNPVSVLKGVVKRPTIKHNVALNPDEISKLLLELKKYGGYRVTVLAMELLMLTFVRTVELRKANWTEFNFDTEEWRIPAERMKMKIPHVVPLSKQAIIRLRELQTITGSGLHLFPNLRRPGAFMTATTINQALKRVGFSGTGTIGFSAHGFRGTASTILYEKEYRSEVIEKQLAHSEKNKSKAAYNHAQYLPARKIMMQEWSDYIDTLRPFEASSPVVEPECFIPADNNLLDVAMV